MFVDWTGDPAAIQSAMDQPLGGILFDVENYLWMDSWGERPDSPEERKQLLMQLISKAPSLIPVFAHRFIVDFSLAKGCPVLSIHQSDIIVYGANLQTYLEDEFVGILDKDARSSRTSGPTWEDVGKIPFWGKLIER